MKFTKTDIEGAWIVDPVIHGDSRGYFMESFSERAFEGLVDNVHFVQDNESLSSYGVLRGLHYQKGEAAQAKIVRVIRGKVLDVAVDLRKSSATFLKYIMVELTGENHRQLYIPRGCAHGFLVLSPDALFQYKVDNLYCPESEASLRYDDPQIGIPWPKIEGELKLSDKDLKAPFLSSCSLYE